METSELNVLRDEDMASIKKTSSPSMIAKTGIDFCGIASTIPRGPFRWVAQLTSSDFPSHS